jgi:hypothetical protein
MKRDLGKLRYDLIPPQPLALLARVFQEGAKHDDPRSRAPGYVRVKNWRTLYRDALMRHYEAYRGGEWLDPGSGTPHLIHVAANAIILTFLHIKKERSRP